jgi:hypothetical protein
VFIPFVSKGTGLIIPFYLGACAWIVQIWFPVQRPYPSDYVGQVFLLGGIAAFIHAFILLRKSRMTYGHGAPQRDTIWSNTLFGLPVIFWSVAFFGFSLWNFFWR